MTNCLYGQRKTVKKAKYKGFTYLIVTHMTHPCCYIEIPEGHILYGIEDYEDTMVDFIECHGGITHAGQHHLLEPNKFYIGWDYAHAGDYLHMKHFGIEDKFDLHRKKHTLKELIEDCKKVIEQIM